MSKLNKDEVIENFTEAYKKAKGKTPDVEANGSWYSVDGGKNMRLAQLQEWTDELNSGSSGNKKPSKTKAESKQKSAKKASSNGGFSVKSFWAEKIQSHNAGGKLPR